VAGWYGIYATEKKLFKGGVAMNEKKVQVLLELKETIEKLMQVLEKVEETETTVQVEHVSVDEIMQAIKEFRHDDVKEMKNKLENYLMYAPAKNRKDFASNLVYYMYKWGEELRAVEKFKSVLLKLLEEKFNAYYEWIEDLNEKADKLSEDIEKLYRKFS
jgi:FKBP-type peptidyl-prolyl cis-trans isomerase